ncbi:FAD/NAD(P)-binding domain-containing protein [Mycena leptocephala]|nr:FAD/NAD(P)-binding domain-containing protein [Mycena leptocephala]
MASISKTAADVIILGGRPAGLSAALALSRVLRTSILFDSEEYRNAPAAEMHTIIGFDGVPPAQFRATARREIKHYAKTTFVKHKVSKVEWMPNGFMVDGKPEWTSRKLIIASGSSDIIPEVPGAPESSLGKAHLSLRVLPRSRSRRQSGALWGAPTPHNLPFFSITSNLTLLLHGAAVPEPLQSVYDHFTENNNPVIAPRVSHIKERNNGAGGVTVHFEDGQLPSADKQAAPFAAQLGLELDERNNIVVTAPFNATSVPGVFASGDSATMMKSVGQAMMMGVLNAGGAVYELMNEDLGRVQVCTE